MSATAPQVAAPATDAHPVAVEEPIAAATPAVAQVPEAAAVEPGFKVFAGNLTYATDEAALKGFFAAVADDILSVAIILRGQRSSGYGFVTFKTQATAEKAVETLDKKELDGRTVIVELAKPNAQKNAERDQRRSKKRTSGRRGAKAVPGEVTEAEANGEAVTAAPRIDDAHDEGQGEVLAPKPKKKRHTKKKSKAAVAAAVANGEGVVAVNGNAEHPVEEGHAVAKPVRAKKPRAPRVPRPPRAEGEQPIGEPSKSVLFVANLAFSVDEPALTEFFTAAGINVLSARVVRRRWGTPRKSKGYGFVDVGNEEEQKKAIEATHGKVIADREVTVKIAVDAKRDEEAAHQAQHATDAESDPVAAAAPATEVAPVA